MGSIRFYDGKLYTNVSEVKFEHGVMFLTFIDGTNSYKELELKLPKFSDLSKKYDRVRIQSDVMTQIGFLYVNNCITINGNIDYLECGTISFIKKRIKRIIGSVKFDSDQELVNRFSKNTKFLLSDVEGENKRKIIHLSGAFKSVKICLSGVSEVWLKNVNIERCKVNNCAYVDGDVGVVKSKVHCRRGFVDNLSGASIL